MRLLRPRHAWLGLFLLAPSCVAPPKERPAAPYVVQRGQDDAGKANNYPNVDLQVAESLSAAFAQQAERPAAATPQPTPRPLTILAVSGGGQYGAYGAGLLVGWTATGQRPEFDVITGISSGAFIAAITYVGPKWDPLLTKVFTTTRTRDLIRRSPVVSLLRSQSLADSGPMRRLIEREVTAEFIEDMRAAHRAGRSCFIGTMNENTRRPVLWDLGAIACLDRPDAGDLVRKLLLAAAAVPGLLPAVEFDVTVNGIRYRESHVDGGAVCQSFVRLPAGAPRPDPAYPGRPWLAGSKLYVIAGGKVYCDPIDGRPGLVNRIRSTISGTLYALYRSDLWRCYSICAASGMSFRHAAIPQDVSVPPNAFEFDPVAMTGLYKLGYESIRCGEVWRTDPPGIEGEEILLPRAGFEFTLPGPYPGP